MSRLLLQQSAAYIQFMNSLRSKDTKIHYTNWLNDFLQYLNISCDKVLDFDANHLQQIIIKYVIDMRDNRKLWFIGISVTTYDLSFYHHCYEMVCRDFLILWCLHK